MSGFKAYVYLTFHFVINKSLIKLRKRYDIFYEKNARYLRLDDKKFQQDQENFSFQVIF